MSSRGSDVLTDTVNYSRFYGIVKEVMEGPSLNLLEAVAHRIASYVLERHPVESVMVRLKKPEVPIKGSILDYAAVQIYRRRE